MVKLTKEYIQKRMNYLGIKQTDIARRTPSGKASVSNWVNAVAVPKGEDYRIFINCLRLMVDEHGELVEIDNQKVMLTKSVPVLNYVQAGNFTTIEAVDAIEKFEIPMKDIPKHNQYFLLKIEGDSMYNPDDKKSMADGDIVLVDATIQPNIGNIVVAKNGDHEATIKKLAGDPGVPMLVPLNPEFKRFDQYNLRGKDYRVVGVATKVYSVRSIY